MSLLALLLALLVLTALTSSRVGAQLDYSRLAVTSVTSDGSCTDTFPTVSLCSLPATLTVSVSGIPANASLPYAYLILDNPAAEVDAYVQVLRLANTTSLYTVPFLLSGYNPAFFGVPLDLFLYDRSAGVRSQALKGGLSLPARATPTLSAIAGCEGSGAATELCAPDHDVLYFSGTGLSLFLELSVFMLTLGGRVTALGSGAVLSASESVLALKLNSSYVWVVQPENYDGTLLPVGLRLTSYSLLSNAQQEWTVDGGLSVSFAPLPPPIITSLQAGFLTGGSGGAGCSPSNTSTPSSLAFVGCVAGTNSILLTGHYLYQLNMSLSAPGKGVWLCENYGVGDAAHYQYAFLPLIPEDEPGLAWDLTVVTPTGQLTFPGLITYSTAPYLSSLVSCTNFSPYDTNPFYTSCTAGRTLTVLGSNFPKDPALSIVLSSSPGPTALGLPPLNVSCLTPLWVDSRTLTCVIPSLDAAVGPRFWGVTNAVRAVFPSTGQASTALSAVIVAYPDSPIVTSISGCAASTSPLSVTGCKGGDVLTLRGFNLSTAASAYIQLYDEYVSYQLVHLEVLPGVTSTLVQAALPFVSPADSPFVAGLQYQVRWFERRTIAGPLTTWSAAYGTAFFVQFDWAVVEGTTAQSNLPAVLAGVLTPTLVLALALAVWLGWRRVQVKRRTAFQGDVVANSGRFNEVELED